jgi:hypothetical protein
MPSFWRTRPRRPQRPPSPFVEDEFESLSHELGGLSLLGEKPGVEGVCERGTIDQYPILLTIETVPPPRSATADSDASQQTSLTSKSSKESLGPPTPPPPEVNFPPQVHTNVLHPGSYSSQPKYHIVSDQSSTSQPDLRRGPPANPRFKNSSKDLQGSRGHNASSSASPEISTTNRRGTGDAVGQPRRGRPDDIESTRFHQRPTVAELIEEKLRYRREQQSARQVDEKRYPPQEDKPKEQIRTPLGAASSASAPQSPLHNQRDATKSRSQPSSPGSENEAGSSTSFISRSTSASAREQITQDASASSLPKIPTPNRGQTPRSALYTQPSSTRDRRAVSFVDEINQLDQPRTSPPPPSSSYAPTRTSRPVSDLPPSQPPRTISPPPSSYAPTRTTRPVSDLPPSQPPRTISPPKEITTRRAEATSNLSLRPCPRSVPVAGHQDWYTISGLTHLNICPSCMNQIGHSKFRDYFVPSLPKPRDVKYRCSFSEPWTRLAWLQTVKKGLVSLEMLYQISRPSQGCKPCPGRTSSLQTWYRVIDPETGMNVPKFVACSACVQNLRALMLPHRYTFRWSPLVQERACDLAVDSPRFVRYLDLLDAAANHCEAKGLASPDTTEFVDYVHRKCELRDCRRDRLILSTWHFIPELPEFSVCEDCYDDVVRPLAAAHKPVARMVSRSARLLPGSGPTRCREASCQLYSPRMRTRFRDAVLNDDFSYLRSVALKRYDAECRYRERKQRLLYDESRGYDVDAELRQNMEEWKKWE